jgi:sugar O-acyltransferase (sialic acid O-acetyltransferase NeuD family)
MNRKLVIFGDGQIAQVACYMFRHDGSHSPVAFTVDRSHFAASELLGLPVVPFDELAERFPPTECDAFVAISYVQVNRLRAAKVAQMKSLGYRLASYVSPRATTFPDLSIGENCFVLEDNTIQPYARIGSNVFMWSGNHLGHHSQIHDHCFIASHVVISGAVEIGEYSFLGVNATLRDNIKVGKGNVIGAGCVILKDTEDMQVFAAQGAEASRVPSNRLRGI